MDVADIAFAAWRMDGDVGDHAPADELLADKIAHQFQVLLEGQFVGKCDIEGAGKLAVLALFDFLNCIPELQTVEHPAGRIIGGVYLGMQDAAAPSVVEGFAKALILKNGTGPVGGCGDGALALAPADEDGGEMILCHAVTTRRSSGGNARPDPAGKRWPWVSGRGSPDAGSSGGARPF